jgi:hypothetical protein
MENTEKKTTVKGGGIRVIVIVVAIVIGLLIAIKMIIG